METSALGWLACSHTSPQTSVQNERRAPEPAGDSPNGGGRDEDAEERGDRGGDVEKVDGAGAMTHEQDRQRVGHVDRGRLVVPHIGVQRPAASISRAITAADVMSRSRGSC